MFFPTVILDVTKKLVHFGEWNCFNLQAQMEVLYLKKFMCPCKAPSSNTHKCMYVHTVIHQQVLSHLFGDVLLHLWIAKCTYDSRMFRPSILREKKWNGHKSQVRHSKEYAHGIIQYYSKKSLYSWASEGIGDVNIGHQSYLTMFGDLIGKICRS